MKLVFLKIYFFVLLMGISSNAMALACVKVSENQTAALSCPVGQSISSVGIASYGNPTGTNGVCGSFAVSNCNSVNSRTAVQNLCKVGDKGCAVPASNSLFGDPCRGVGKTLAIQINCAPSWVKCASEYASCAFTGTRNVRYGANGVYVTKTAVTGPVACTNAFFGRDPAYGVTKICEYTLAQTLPLPAPAPAPLPGPTPSPAPAPAPAPTTVGSSIVPPAAIAIPGSTLNLPSSIANGSTISLQCGQVYRGTLNLTSKSDVTINVAGTCGKPTIIPFSTNDNGINANSSVRVTISGIKIQGALRGINGLQSQYLNIQNTDVLNSADAGIVIGGSDHLTVQNSSVSHSGATGLSSEGGITNAVITNVTAHDTGYAGGNYRGQAFYIYGGSNNHLDHVTASDSVYHGIVVLQTPGSWVKNSLAKNSCMGPDHDCGAIYAGSPQLVPQNITIDSNRVDGSRGMGIYLDDSANAITVTNNDVLNCDYGMLLHNAYDTVISNNRLSSNTTANFALSDDLSRMKNNKFTYNTVTASSTSQIYNLYSRTLNTIASYDYNTYRTVSGTSASVVGWLWTGSGAALPYNYTQWKSVMPGQDSNSTFNGAR